MRSAPLRLVVVDDHALFRRGLIGLLNDMPEFRVVGEAGNGREALADHSDIRAGHYSCWTSICQKWTASRPSRLCGNCIFRCTF